VHADRIGGFRAGSVSMRDGERVKERPSRRLAIYERKVPMKRSFIAASLVAGLSLVSVSAFADDRDSERNHPVAFVKDSVITTKIKAKLAAEKANSMVNIHVDTDEKGMVVMSGTAHTKEDIAKAEEIAKGTEGVTSVTNNVTVKADD
jgi:hyperosmotically inducible protein